MQNKIYSAYQLIPLHDFPMLEIYQFLIPKMIYRKCLEFDYLNNYLEYLTYTIFGLKLKKHLHPNVCSNF
jgi:uncharacterized membrane protein